MAGETGGSPEQDRHGSGTNGSGAPSATIRSVASDRRRYHDLTPLICLTTAGSISPQIRRAVGYLDRQYAGRLTLGGVAGQIGYHPAHLSRKFHQELGVSFSGYLVRLRLKHAIRWLVYTDLPIKAVGYGVGFGRPEHFAKVFGRWLQCAPTVFRIRYRYQHAGYPGATARQPSLTGNAKKRPVIVLVNPMTLV